MTIPRGVLDARTGDQTTNFIVLVDGQMVPFNENTSSTARTLSIAFPHGTRSIEIIGTQMGSSSDVNIAVSTDKSTYYENDTIEISGMVSEILYGNNISLVITGPNGETISIDQLKVHSSKKFSTTESTGGPLYEKAGSGTYTVSVMYGAANRPDETTFQYIEYTPEPSIMLSSDKSSYKENQTIHESEFYGISIIGDDSCKIRTINALELLKNTAKRHFEIVTDNIRTIKCVDQGSGITVQDSRVLIGKITMDAGTIWYAGVLVHESCHSLLYHDYLKNNPKANYVPSDVYSGKNAERICLGLQYYALSMIDHGRYTSGYFVDLLESEYWQIPYADRWW